MLYNNVALQSRLTTNAERQPQILVYDDPRKPAVLRELFCPPPMIFDIGLS